MTFYPPSQGPTILQKARFGGSKKRITHSALIDIRSIQVLSALLHKVSIDGDMRTVTPGWYRLQSYKAIKECNNRGANAQTCRFIWYSLLGSNLFWSRSQIFWQASERSASSSWVGTGALILHYAVIYLKKILKRKVRLRVARVRKLCEQALSSDLSGTKYLFPQLAASVDAPRRLLMI
jgi:hypothetical protein